MPWIQYSNPNLCGPPHLEVFAPVPFPDTPTPGSEQDEADHPDRVPVAFIEEPQASLANIYGNTTVEQATSQLNGTLDALFIAGSLPLVPRPVRTLISAKQHLGLDADQYITQYALYTACWKHYTLKELMELSGPHCILEDCAGKVHETYQDSKGKRRCCTNNDKDFVMKDISDGAIWHMSQTQTQREYGDQGTVQDLPTEGGSENLNAHRFGLHLSLNTDWFGMLERPHSTGPIYYCINDLPIHECFLQCNTICPCIMPGPKEPTAEQINHCMEPSMKEIAELKNGVEMEVHGEEPQIVFTDESINNCDTPGAHKTCGLASHTQGIQPCPWCDITSVDINRTSGYTREVCAGVLRICCWAGYPQCDALSTSCTMCSLVLFNGYMFSGAGGQNSLKQHFEDMVNSVRWPSHVTRLLKNLGENQSLKKADEWQRLLHITPILLWWVWKDTSDEVPD
ncbi:hypothetical protein NEOLEDRAFT_1151707 [Neolentinus lepideus HHB14362 ss-1]|uniref:Uncharacterized protein n=1 Tax=Neolentinus lepideus HHB14362 ss-1 TaxID=1314782 RepID=A0A165NMC2_9AGAM|nr:hypothetical protein NEOLEDRAFT_1151707 [Neolentinus lepideus HHB14362 ss-1]